MMDFQGTDCYIEREIDRMSPHRPNPPADYIRQLAAQHHVVYTSTRGDELADYYSRLADNEPVVLDEVEQMLIALRRAGHLDRSEVVRLQASYLNEPKP
jgi:hypothetical protein